MLVRVSRFLGAFLVCICIQTIALADERLVELQADSLPETIAAELDNALQDFEAPRSRLEARRHVRRAARIANRLLNSAGYFAPSIETGVSREPPFKAWLRIDPGPQFTLQQIDTAYGSPVPPENVRSAVESGTALTPGDAAIPENILVERQRLKTDYLERGYADVLVEEPDLLGDQDEATIALTFPITTGPLVRLGPLIVTGANDTKASFVERLRPYSEGDLYTPQSLAILQRRLSSTRHYRDVSVSLAPASGDDGDEAERTVLVNLEERPRHTIALGGSISTDQGVGGLLEWTRWNLTGRADPLTLTAEASQIEQSLTTNWNLPHFPGPGRQLSLQGAIFNEDTDAFNRSGIRIGGAFEFARSQRNVWSLGGDYELSAERGEVEDRLLQTVTLSGALRLDRSNSLTDPTRGWRASFSAQPGFSFGDDEAVFLRNTAQASAYLPLSKEDRWVLAGRFEIGSLIGPDTLTLPVDERFFAGGGASVRGFGFQEIGPRDAEGNPVGGRSLFETSAEVRGKLTRRIGIAAFVDAGSVGDNALPDLNDIQVGAGAGLRYATPAGPVRFDVAFPIDRTEFDRGFQIYLSIGQAF